LLVVPSRVYKWSINPFTNPNPVYSHSIPRDNNLHYSPLAVVRKQKSETEHLQNFKAREPVDYCFGAQGSAVLFLKLLVSFVSSSHNLQKMKLLSRPRCRACQHRLRRPVQSSTSEKQEDILGRREEVDWLKMKWLQFCENDPELVLLRMAWPQRH
jgi:hypothetical protein